MKKIKYLIPDVLRLFLYRCIASAYKANEIFVSKSEIYQSIIGRQTAPYNKRLLIEYNLYHNAKSVEGLTSQYVGNRYKNSHHVELRYGQLIITLSRLSHINGVMQVIPRAANFRSNLSKDNYLQMEMFNEPIESAGDQKIHLVLTHRGGIALEEVELLMLDEKNKVLDRYSLVLSEHEKQSDVNTIDEFTPEILETRKRKAE